MDKEIKLCHHCGVDMTNWPRKDEDGVNLVWEIVTTTDPSCADCYDHLYWSCHVCHSDGVADCYQQQWTHRQPTDISEVDL